MNIDPQTLTYSGLGASALALAGYILWNIARRSGDLDGRVLRMIDGVTKPLHDVISRLDAIVVDERAEKLRAQDARDKTMQMFVDETMKQQRDHAADMRALRAENAATTTQINGRLDACEREHATSRGELAAARSAIEKLEGRERDWLKQMPPPGERQTILPVVLQAPPSG